MGFLLYIAISIETLKEMSLTQRMKAHADFLEALGVIEKWQKASKKENKELTRLAELILSMLNRHQDLTLEISDLKTMNVLIRNDKNRIIQELKDKYNEK